MAVRVKRGGLACARLGFLADRLLALVILLHPASAASFASIRVPRGAISEADAQQMPPVLPGVVPENDPGNWFFHVQTTVCNSTVKFDNAQDSVFSRVALPAFALLCILFVSVPSPAAVVAGGVSGGGAAAEGTEERRYDLDFARITAVMCVIFEHDGGMGYTRRNVGFGLWWAMPFLCMTSGMALMISKSSMPAYLGRLILLFLAGVSANWTADVLSHRDWRHDFFNTIFQMFFVVMLFGMALVAEPLRKALRYRAAEEDCARKGPPSMAAAAVGYAVLAFVGLMFFAEARPVMILPKSSPFMTYYEPLSGKLPIFLAKVFGMLFLAQLACVVGTSQHIRSAAWVLLAFMYVPPIIIPWSMGDFAQLLSCYVFGMVVVVHPPRGSEFIARTVRAYWPILFMVLCLLSMPDMVGRCDMFPAATYWERFRHRSGTCLLILCFGAGAFRTSDPLRITSWLGYWSLYAYICHVAWFRLLGATYGAVVTFASMAPFYLLHRKSTPPPPWSTASAANAALRHVKDQP